MKKIPCIFLRDPADPSRLLDEINPDCEWVFRGGGLATRKWDGTACMIRDGNLYKRYDCKQGRTPPAGFEPCQEPDAITGHWPGWVPVGDGPDDAWAREAFSRYHYDVGLSDGTYELCGPKIGGNPERMETHVLVRHGNRDFTMAEIRSRNSPQAPLREQLTEFLRDNPMEGLVWHHPDGRMAKIKRCDLGLPWPVEKGR